MEYLNWFILGGGVLGVIGTLLGWKTFFDEARLASWIDKYGVKQVRIVVLLVYLMFALAGAFFVVVG